MGRPRLHGTETADALLAVAERIAAADGIAGLSIRRLADEAGTTTRAVYSLFGSKEGMVAALAAHGLDLLAEDLATMPVTDPLEDLVEAGAVVFRRFAAEHPALFEIVFRREGIPDHVAAQFDHARRAALDQLTERLKRLAVAGGLACPVDRAALYFHALCEGLAGMESRASGAFAGEETWRSALRALLLGMSIEGSTPSRQHVR